MAPIPVIKTYKGCVKNKRRPWKNINRLLVSKTKDEETKIVTVFDALFMKNIERQKRVKREVKKCVTPETVLNKKCIGEESDLESTFDRILAGPVLQDVRPPQVTGSSEYDTSSGSSVSRKPLTDKHESPKYSFIGKRHLRSRKLKRRVERKSSPCLTSTPKCSKNKESESNPVVSPILERTDKENIPSVNSSDINMKEFSPVSYSPLLRMNSVIVTNEDIVSDIVHSFSKLTTGTSDPNSCTEHKLKDCSKCEDVSNGVGKPEENTSHKVSKPRDESIILFDSWNSTGDIEGEHVQNETNDLEEKLNVTSPQSTEYFVLSNDVKTPSPEEQDSDDVPLMYLKNTSLPFQMEEPERQNETSGNSFEQYCEKLYAQNKKSFKRLSCRRLSHQVVPHQLGMGRHINSPSFRDVHRASRRKSTVAEAILEDDKEISTIEEAECESEQSSAISISVDVPFTARDAVLQRSDQCRIIPFCEAFTSSYLETCRKIGEGVYGEVFMSKGKDGTVLKIIPIEGEQLVNGEPQKKFDEILSEIVITMELSNLRLGTKNRTQSFSEMKRCLCVQGKYPEELVNLWYDYDEQKGSENDSPLMFMEDQLYIVLEMANGGQDLEAYVFTSAEQSLSILVQTAYALAVSEEALEFEHRDLHWGNVLISPTSDKDVVFRLCGEEHVIPTKGVQVAIIDFTLSRMLYDGCCIYNDLSRDPELFTGQGDYQFEVYRLMQKHTMDVWDNFVPYTNVLWLRYLMDKMCTMVNYRKKPTKCHKQAMESLLQLQNVVLKYSSATEFVRSNEHMYCLS